jgi:hypothetical protein
MAVSSGAQTAPVSGVTTTTIPSTLGAMPQRKERLGARGIIFNTWNGYAEGYAAVPTTEHGSTVYNWLTDLYASEPSECHHVEYVSGVATYVVSGDIRVKWRDFGGRFGALGDPIGDEVATTRARSSHFEHGSVFAATATACTKCTARSTTCTHSWAMTRAVSACRARTKKRAAATESRTSKRARSRSARARPKRLPPAADGCGR